MITLLEASKIVFWDFDGVIKDSVEVKTTAYVELFRPYGKEIYDRVKQHHEAHSGVSRFDKIPLYLAWAGEPVTAEKVAELCEYFSQLVVQAVINSPWVPGVYEYLLAHCKKQYFVLVTATPQREIEHILAALNIAHCFCKCYGAPTGKTIAINDALQQLKISPSDAIMLGDAEGDYKAALANHVAFVLRRTAINHHLQARHEGAAFNNLDLQ
ncbi:HAD family hydrolase [Candidatus Njordibacter sp. Uisw_039]|uniref:HAD family hydrolase n=1 Tax=Candidatus Njordibacter sp. Uisw_039 TaxID=3230972 RepID=UPI003D4A38A3